MERKFNPSKLELEKLYQTNSCAQIGKMHGVNSETVRKRLHEHQIPMGKVGGRRAFDPPKEVLQELYQVMSMLEIAKLYGCGETIVFKRLKEHGISLEQHVNHRLKPGRIFTEQHKLAISIAHRTKAAYGEKNPNWKGGLAAETLRARGSWQYREWKKNSLVRAGYKCECCGVVDGVICECCGVKVKLHVHHVKSFSKHIESRFDPENSEVLCPQCHRKKHTKHL